MPPSGDAFAVNITVGGNQAGLPNFNSSRRLRPIVEQQGRSLLSGALEQALTIEPLTGTAVHGFHYSLTDKTSVGRPPKPGDYSHLTGGPAGTGGLLIFFSIFLRDRDAPERQAALVMLATARQSTGPAAKAPATGSQRASLSLPGYRW